MKRILIAASMMSCVFLTACGSSDSEESTPEENVTVATTPTDGLATNSTDTAKSALESAINQPGATPAATTSAAATGKVNPAHGQPGHICELPVGAPLDGSVAPAAAPKATAQPNIQMQPQAAPAAQPAQAATASGTNPPHGQPGHVCEKPVGAPL